MNSNESKRFPPEHQNDRIYGTFGPCVLPNTGYTSGHPKAAMTDSNKAKGESANEERELVLLEAERLQQLGNIEFEQGAYVDAIECYRTALGIFRKFGDRVGEGKLLGNLATVEQACGNTDGAIAHYTEAREIAIEVGDRCREGYHRSNLGNVYLACGDSDSALEHFVRALEISRELGDRIFQSHVTSNLGRAYLVREDLGKAFEYFDRALEISREVGDRTSEGICLGNMGNLLHRMGRTEEAEKSFRQAIHIGDDTMPLASGSFRSGLARLLAEKGRFDEIASILRKAEPLVAENPEEYAKFLCNSAHIHLLRGDTNHAEAELERARSTLRGLPVADESELSRGLESLAARIDAARNESGEE